MDPNEKTGSEACMSDRARYLIPWRRRIGYIPALCHITHSVTAALMLSQMMYLTTDSIDKDKHPDEWIYQSREEWEWHTGLSRKEQITARKILKGLGVVELRMAGLPAMMQFRLCHDVLQKILDNLTLPPRPKHRDLPKKDNSTVVPKGDASVVPKGDASVVPKGDDSVVPKGYDTGCRKGTTSRTEKGRVSNTRVLKAEEADKDLPPQPPQGGDGADTPPLASRDGGASGLEKFAVRIGVTDMRVLRKLEPVFQARQPGAEEEMARSWLEYLNHPKRIGKPMSMTTFFTQGYWLNRDSWITLGFR